MDEIITKRLHISGLTPAFTAEDLTKRLSTFGTVKAADGFGLKDALGQSRKYGYVTLETTQGKLSRCLNLLSGSTWKGAKLRIGEAKPDFRERIVVERDADEQPPRKRRRCAGVYAPDMSLVTTENAVGRGGWKITPLGRLVRHVRMRPERPLPPMNEDKEKRARKGKKTTAEAGKKKKRVKEPDIRARRRTIDVTRYRSVHLKGMFLDMEVLGTKRDGHLENAPEVQVESSVGESDSDESQHEEGEPEAGMLVTRDAESPSLPPISSNSPSRPAVPVPGIEVDNVQDHDTDLIAEKNHSLNILASLFGNNSDANWVGRESVGSDIDEEEIAKRHRMIVDENDDGDFEVVPMDADFVDQLSGGEEEEDQPRNAMIVAPTPPPRPPTQKEQQATKLKDLFAPREEEIGFSLVGHLDLDLELDDEIPFVAAEILPATQVMHKSITTTVPTKLPTYTAPQLNNKLPFFFPLPPSSGTNTKARSRDVFDVARENKWHWRDPNVGFFRTGTEEDIRKRWEESKVDLTREWKRRCREAGKVSRRRRGGDKDGDHGIGE